MTSGRGLLNSFSTGIVHSVDNFHPWNYGAVHSVDRPLTCNGAVPEEQGVPMLALCPCPSTPVDNFLHPLCTRGAGTVAADH